MVILTYIALAIVRVEIVSDSLNSVTLSGNLGQDAEVRYTNSGLVVTSFSLAVNKSRKQQDGSYKDVTSWVDCVMYGKRGEAMFNNGLLMKGARLAILGHLHQNVWEKDSKRYRKLEVIVDNVAIMTLQRQSQQQAAAPQAATCPDLYDEDIPF